MTYQTLDLQLTVSNITSQNSDDKCTVELQVKLVLVLKDLISGTIFSQITKNKLLTGVFLNPFYGNKVLVSVVKKDDILLETYYELGSMFIGKSSSSSRKNNYSFRTLFSSDDQMHNGINFRHLEIGALDMSLDGQLIVLLEKNI